MKTILAYRFSALGDVVLAYPVLKTVLEHNPDVRIIFATRSKFAPLFQNIDRLEVLPIDFDEKHKGLWGIITLFFRLKKNKISSVADLHLILRTRILDFLFRCCLIKVATIDKDRKRKKLLTRRVNKMKEPLEHSAIRYLRVFKKLGLAIPDNLPFVPFQSSKDHLKTIEDYFFHQNIQKKDDEIWVGIAPFAQHDNKIWGVHKIEALIAALIMFTPIKIFLFGGGKKEIEILENIRQKHPHRVENMAGKFSLLEELAFMSKLDKMLAMDSANMHLASMAGTKVYSIWGATHPFAGFYALFQNQSTIIQLEDLACRPCSVFGDKPCWRGDKWCMEGIQVEQVKNKLLEIES